MNEQRASGFTGSQVTETVLVCFLVSVVFLFSQWRYSLGPVLELGDEGWLWYASQRTALGDVPLRDFFSYDPGRYYWSALAFKVLGKNGLFELIMAEDLFGLIGLVVVYYLMSRLAIDRKWRIATILLLAVCLGYPRHKIYEQTLSLISLAGITVVLSRPSSRCWFFYGLATGLAAFIGRNSGLFFLAAAVLALGLSKLLRLALPPRNAIAAYPAGIVVGYLPMLLMLAGVHGFAAAFWKSLLLNPKQIIPVPIPFPWRLHALGISGLQAHAVSILLLAAPIAYALLLLLFPRTGSELDQPYERKLIYGASIAGIPYLFHAFSNALFPHIAQATLPLVVACCIFSEYLYKAGRRGLSFFVLLGLSILVLACWLPHEPFVAYIRAPNLFAPIEIQNRRFEMLKSNVQLMHIAEASFQGCGSREGSMLAPPSAPGIYAYLKTRAPFWEVYFIFPRFPHDEDFQTSHIAALIQNRTALVVLLATDEMKMADNYPRLLDYIRTHYQPMNSVSPPEDIEVWYNPALCGT